MAFTVITYTPEPGASRMEHNFQDKDSYTIADSGALQIAEEDGTLHWLSPNAWYELTDGKAMLSQD